MTTRSDDSPTAKVIWHLALGLLVGGGAYLSVLARKPEFFGLTCLMVAIICLPDIGRAMRRVNSKPVRIVGTALVASWFLMLVGVAFHSGIRIYALNGDSFPTWLADTVPGEKDATRICEQLRPATVLMKSNGVFVACGPFAAPQLIKYLPDYEAAPNE